MQLLSFLKRVITTSLGLTRVALAAMVLTALIVAPQGAGFAHDDDDDDGGGGGGGSVRVMTRNLYFGADLNPIIVALQTGSPPVAAVAGQTLLAIQASKPAERAAAVAREIVRNRVDLVGLQEATIIRVGPFNSPIMDPAGAACRRPAFIRMGCSCCSTSCSDCASHIEVVAIVPGVDAQLPRL